MYTTQSLLAQLTSNPEAIAFSDVISVIDNEYAFTPTAFRNGEQFNNANENNGSCKIMSFAKLNNVAAEHVLNLFGDFYRIDVLQHPEGKDHQNIRQFMIHGWQGIEFEGTALVQM